MKDAKLEIMKKFVAQRSEFGEPAIRVGSFYSTLNGSLVICATRRGPLSPELAGAPLPVLMEAGGWIFSIIRGAGGLPIGASYEMDSAGNCPDLGLTPMYEVEISIRRVVFKEEPTTEGNNDEEQ
jgi:hypothetical protein